MSFNSHPWIKIGVIIQKCSIQSQIISYAHHVTLKFDGWPWKTTGHLFYATSSCVHHFIAISEFKLELQSGNAQFGSKPAIFILCDLETWQMTIKNYRAHFLCHFKLCASFRSHQWIHTRVAVQKHPKWGKICFDLCVLDLLHGHHFVNGNDSWKFHDDTMTGTLWKRCDKQTDGWTEKTDGKDHSYSCLVAAKNIQTH